MTRRIVTNIALSLDGRYAKDDPMDMSWVMPYAVSDAARDHLTSLWESATTAVLGRKNAEGFLGWWPQVIDMDGADPRDVGFARWLVDVDKVVLSTTLTHAPWRHTTLEDRATADVLRDLAAGESDDPGDTGDTDGDVFVVSSASVIRAALEADLVDQLCITQFPVVLGSGPRLFEGGPDSRWQLARQVAGGDGELLLKYDRVR
ncbi:riboflavin biosynthesis protein RibD [Nocardioides anomalus]|uniref:Riboflavin biosynthesis protein RibD n=1 Tax=Nocardioides anomalus TaxID=2712223 RepID=A0A6G6WGR5_9ACTN|nr:dihydrofolate reductase family protein [Nocardioides anomalus]QIG44347.1 riboflavin biosynthesis protein RibD [Nocardioides anomalus]